MALSAKDHIARERKLSEQRSLFDQHWEDLARVMLPRRLGFVTATIDGDRRTEEIYDGTPMQAARGLANAIGGLLRPIGQDWFDVRTAEGVEARSEAASEWLYEAKQRMVAAIDNPASRFRQATAECDHDLVVFGTAVMFAGEAATLNQLSFKTLHLRHVCIALNDDDAVDTVYRRHVFTARQAAQRFGETRLGDKAKDALSKNKPDARFVYLHAVTPRPEGREDAVLARNMPFASVWIEVDSEKEVSEGGFPEMPYIVPRWDTTSGEVYGRSPGMIALPDANTLQAMGETNLVAGQLAAEPPLLAPNDGAFDPINMIPGGISYYDMETARMLGRPPISPLNTGANLAITREMQQDARDQIFAAFFRNVLNLPVQGPQMTATEVMARNEEFIREIGPVFARLESDYTGPLVERVFSVMLRAGAFPAIPNELAGANVSFVYESPVKRIREEVQAAAANLAVQEISLLAQAKGPQVLDLIDEDAYGRFIAQARGLPRQLLRPADEVQRLRQARAEAQQQAQETAEIAEAVQIGGEAARGLRDLEAANIEGTAA